MQYTSYSYILFFMPIVIALYFLANKRGYVLGKMTLVVASILFYSYGRKEMLVYLGLSALINISPHS
jgi:hypothetical protein